MFKPDYTEAHLISLPESRDGSEERWQSLYFPIFRELSIVPTGYNTPLDLNEALNSAAGATFHCDTIWPLFSKFNILIFSKWNTNLEWDLCLPKDSHSAQSLMGQGGKQWPQLPKSQVGETPSRVPFKCQVSLHIVV